MIVSFKDFELEPRYDGTPWTSIRINEASSETGPWNLIDSQALSFDVTVNNPADPQPISFTTDNAVLQPGVGWYKIQLVDAATNIREYDPIFNPATTEILATIDDVNGNLDGEVIEATADNSNLVQVSVARVIRGYLAAVVDTTTLMSWDTPEHTPDIVREIAAKLIAAQVYFHLAARQSMDIGNFNFAQRLYDEAMAMLQGIIDGTIPLPGAGGETTGPGMSDQDYFPIDDTDRAFSMGMLI
jgi:hypothetical protein